MHNTHPEMLHRCKGQLNKREGGNAVNTGMCLLLRQSSNPVPSYLCPRAARMWWLEGVERIEETKPKSPSSREFPEPRICSGLATPTGRRSGAGVCAALTD